MKTKPLLRLAASTVVLGLTSMPASASLSVFQTFTGQYGYSSDGWGSSSSSSGSISASVPAGSTVVAAYLYTSTLSSSTDAHILGTTLAGSAVSFNPIIPNPSIAAGFIGSARADVTSIVKPVIDGGPGGIYNFTIAEASTSRQDGEALVVVYTNPALGTNTFVILDGFSATGGDSFAVNFASPLNPGAPGFQAEMALGIGFSCCDEDVGQSSTVVVNSTTITNEAGSNDDGNDTNGGLITVGGFNDPLLATPLPSYTADRERYSLVPYINAGDTTISVRTNNPSNNDNIFLAMFYVTGVARVNEEPPGPSVPEPGSLMLLGLGLTGLALRRRRRA